MSWQTKKGISSKFCIINHKSFLSGTGKFMLCLKKIMLGRLNMRRNEYDAIKGQKSNE